VDSKSLLDFTAAVASGAVRVVDLTFTLSPDFPVIVLPPEFGQAAPVRIQQISRYDDAGPAWYWNNLTFGEHTGTHFDAPIHWFTGKDLPNNSVDTLPARDMIAPACVIDCSTQAAQDPDFLLTIPVVETWEGRHGRIPERNWVLLRIESIMYVLIGAVALLALAFLIVLGPLIFATAVKFATWLAPLEWNFTVARYAIASVALIIALLIAHKWLPAGRRHLRDIMPGILATLIMWLAAGIIFGRYLAEFASTYVTYYAGLASAMIALVFLYLTASIFVYGGELNAAFARLRRT